MQSSICLKKRREYVGLLSAAGMSKQTIMKMVNAKAPIEGWNEFKTLNNVYKDMMCYIREVAQLDTRTSDETDALRQHHMFTLEKVIEDLSVELKSKNNWKPFERVEALRKKFEMLVEYAKLENWDKSKQNPALVLQNNTNLNFYEKSGDQINKLEKHKLESIIDIIELAKEQLPIEQTENKTIV